MTAPLIRTAAEWLALRLAERGIDDPRVVAGIVELPVQDVRWLLGAPDRAHMLRVRQARLDAATLPDPSGPRRLAADKAEVFRHRPTVTHLCPPRDGGGLTPCCRRTPFELPRDDRMTSDAARVTCAGVV